MEKITIIAAEEDAGQRLDKVLAKHAPLLSRSRLQALIVENHVVVNGKPFADSSAKVKSGDKFVVTVPPAIDAIPVAQNIALDIVYEDKDLLVINKSPDMVVHPAAGNHDGTLVNALLAHCGSSLSGIGGVKRPGIVHRLDKETSGLMVVAKNDAAHHGLSEQLSSRTLKRTYQTIVWGMPNPASGRIETLIGRSKTTRKKMAVKGEGGKEAITDYSTLENYAMIASLVECRLHSGRTHQIRVHMAHIQHWVVGDPVYGKASPQRFLKLQKVHEKAAEALLSFPRQALHAAQLEFIHPIGKNKVSLKAELPPGYENIGSDVAEVLQKQLRSGKMAPSDSNELKSSFGVSAHLHKGEEVALGTIDPGLHRVLVGVGWDAPPEDHGFPVDIDVCAFFAQP